MWMSGKISEKDVKLKRAYESPTDSDGKRILVDRLWPRGIRKTDAAIDYWATELAPSTELRKWFAHDPSLGRSSAGDMPLRSRRIARNLIDCTTWHL